MPAILYGISKVLDIGNKSKKRDYYRSDSEALYNDWKNIGNDIMIAANQADAQYNSNVKK